MKPMAFKLFALNVGRIVSLFLTGIYFPKAFNVMHVEVWQVLFIIFAIGLWIFWIKWTKKRSSMVIFQSFYSSLWYSPHRCPGNENWSPWQPVFMVMTLILLKQWISLLWRCDQNPWLELTTFTDSGRKLLTFSYNFISVTASSVLYFVVTIWLLVTFRVEDFKSQKEK